MDATIEVSCPCGAHLTLQESEILAMAGSIQARRRVSQRRRPKVMRPCFYCHELFGSCELILHRGQCPQRPANAKTGRRAIMRECPHCGHSFQTAELRIHQHRCRVTHLSEKVVTAAKQ